MHALAILEAYGIRYCGSAPGAVELARDKSLVRGAAVSAGVAVPDEVGLTPHQRVAESECSEGGRARGRGGLRRRRLGR